MPEAGRKSLTNTHERGTAVTTGNIFLNIETVPPPMTALEKDALVGPRSKKTADEAWRGLAVDIWAFNICAITFALQSTKDEISPVETIIADRLPNGHPDEAKLIATFAARLAELGVKAIEAPLFTTFNGNGFDLPGMRLRAMKYGNKELSRLIPGKKSDNRSRDYMDEVRGTQQRNISTVVSMADVLQFFGLDSKAGDGSMVFDWWFSKNIDALTKYTVSNVTQLIELDKKIGNLI